MFQLKFENFHNLVFISNFTMLDDTKVIKQEKLIAVAYTLRTYIFLYFFYILKPVLSGRNL